MNLLTVQATRRLHSTDDITLAAFIIARGLASLKAVGGTPQRRVFTFDREIEPTLLLDFYASPERRALDAFRHLKTSVLTE
jgi:hypothetical protein